MLRMLTSGESHNKGISVIIDGMPAGLRISVDLINRELRRRKSGYGRSERMAIEGDCVEILSGIRKGKTIGSPIHLFVKNRDYQRENFEMASFENPITTPRPGHADLTGILKFGFNDIRNVLERASARETVARVSAGAIFKAFLNEFNIQVTSRIISISNVKNRNQIHKIINRAKEKGDTLGGVIEIYGDNVPPGLGTYVHFDKRLDARVGFAMLSIPSVKGIEIGDAFKNALRSGSEVHDEIYYNKEKNFYRKTNRAGGIEGGMSNGERIIVRLYVKPIPTLKKPLGSVDIKKKNPAPALTTRSDICVVPAIGVIGEAMLAYVIADALCEKFGNDCLGDIKKAYKTYQKRIKNV
ncbi:MAG: chorismate synthase [bacterium]